MIVILDKPINITRYIDPTLPPDKALMREVKCQNVPNVAGDIYVIINHNPYYTEPFNHSAGLTTAAAEWFYSKYLQHNRKDSYSRLIILKLSPHHTINLAAVDSSANQTHILGYIYGKYTDYIYVDDVPRFWYKGGDQFNNPPTTEAIAYTAETRVGIEGINSLPPTANVGRSIKYNVWCDAHLPSGANPILAGVMHMADIDYTVYRDDLKLNFSTYIYSDENTKSFEGIIIGFTDEGWYSGIGEVPTVEDLTTGLYLYGHHVNKYIAKAASRFLSNYVVPIKSQAYMAINNVNALDPIDSNTRKSVCNITAAIVKTAFVEWDAVFMSNSQYTVLGDKVPKGSYESLALNKSPEPAKAAVNLDDLSLHLSGGVANTELDNSIGGMKSISTIDITDSILIDDITKAQAARGAKIATCFYLTNGGVVPAAGIRVHIAADNVKNADVLLAVGYTEVNGAEPLLTNREALLDGLVHKAAYTEATALRLPVIPIGGHVAVWVTIDLKAGCMYNNESFRMIFTQRL